MKPHFRSLFRPRCVVGPLMGLAAALSAQQHAAAQASGSWNVDAGSNWSVAGSWVGNTVATGAEQTASFANNLTADRTVTLDTARTIGQILFGDTDVATAASWIIAPPATAQTLTLNNGANQPIITVDPLGTGKLAVINAPVASAAGLRKAGLGTLRLGGANPGLSGPLDVENGRLVLNNNGALGGITELVAHVNTAVVGGTGPGLEIGSNITLGAGATLTLAGEDTSGDYRTSFVGNGNSVWEGAVRVAGLRPALNAVNTGTPFRVNGPVTLIEGAAPLILFVRGAGLGEINGTVDIGVTPFFKTDAGTWTVSGGPHVWGVTGAADGVIRLGAANAVPTTVPLEVGQGSATVGRFELNGFDQTVTGLRTAAASTAAGSQTVRNFSATPATLTDIELEGTTSVYKGTITSNVHLKKAGPGILQLEGNHDHLDTTVTEGALVFNTIGSILHPAPLIVEAGGSVGKTGTGVAQVGTLNATGPVRVTEGTLAFGDGTGTGALTATGFDAALGFGVNGGRLTVGALNAGENPGDTSALRFTMDGGAAPYVTVTGADAFTVNGAATVNVVAANLAPGTYPLIDYSGSIGGAGFAGLTLGSTPHLTAELQNNVAESRVDLKVTAMDSLVWTGLTDNTWFANEPGIENFKLASSGANSAFFQGDRVLFDDSGINTFINLNAGILAGDLTFNNTVSVEYNVAGALGGSGTITKNNTGILTLAGANVFTGKVVVNGGILKAGNAAALGSAAAGTEIAGGTLDVNALSLGREPIRIAGAGADGVGAIINGGAGNNNALRRVTLTDDAAVGGSGRWDIRNQNEGGDFLDLAGHTLTKTGTNQISLVGVSVSSGDMVVNEGTFSFETGTKALGTGSITVNPGATLGAWTLADGNVTLPITLNGGIFNELGSGGTATFDSPVTVAAASSVGAGTAASVLRLDGVVSGTAALEKINAGVVTLNADNTFSGPLTITAGTLRVGNGGATGDLGGVTAVTNNATLDIRRNDTALVLPAVISGTGAVTLNGAIGSVITLTGDNTFTGAVTVTAGGLRITRAGALGTGTKNLILTNGTAGNPQLRLDGSGGDITLPATVSLQTSNTNVVNSVIVNEAGNNTILGTITLTAGGGNSYVRSDAGLLTLAGNISPNTTARAIQLAGAADGVLSGNLNNNGANIPALEKLGSGTWTITSTGSTYTGATTVIAGRLVVDGLIKGANLVVNDGTILAGRGTVAPTGAGVANVNGRISPGGVAPGGASATGALTLGSLADTTQVNLSATSGFSYDLGAPTLAGTDYDTLQVQGTLALGEGLVDLNDFQFVPGAGFGAGVYTLAQAAGITGSLGTLTSGVVGGRPAALAVAGTNLVLTVGAPIGGYSSWAAGKGLAGPAAEPAADPDTDGVANLLEYSADTNPSSAGSVPPLAVSASPYGMGFTRIPAHADLTYEVQVSTDLSAWTTVATSVGGLPTTVIVPGAGTVTETGTSPVAVAIDLLQTGPVRFARLKVVLP